MVVGVPEPGLSLSPVPIYIMFVLLGSIAMSVTERSPRLSVLVVQVLPPLVLFHNPPEGVHAYIIFGLPRNNLIWFTLPSPPPFVGTEVLPIYVQLALATEVLL